MQAKLRVASLLFRSAALGAKFGLFFVLAIFLAPEEVGVFGLVAATVNFSLYFLGMDFYIHANREFRVGDQNKRKFVLAQTARLFVVTHAVMLPTFFLLFHFEVLPWRLLPFVIALSVLEHISTELYRLLIAFGRPVLASFGFFLRLGLWPFVAASGFFLFPHIRTLETVMFFWLIGTALSIIAPAMFVLRWPRSLQIPGFDWGWIKAGLYIALPFLLGTLCLRGMQTVDRYLFDLLVGPEILGAFVLFLGLAGVVPAMLQAGVYSFALPVLLSSAHDKEWVKFSSQLKELRTGLLIGSVILSVGVLIGARLMLILIDKPVYLENFSLLFFALAANLLFAFSMYFHLALYACKKDNLLALSHVTGLVAFGLGTIAFSPISIFYAVPFGLVFGNFAILLTKYLSFRKHDPRKPIANAEPGHAANQRGL